MEELRNKVLSNKMQELYGKKPGFQFQLKLVPSKDGPIIR